MGAVSPSDRDTTRSKGMLREAAGGLIDVTGGFGGTERVGELVAASLRLWARRVEGRLGSES
jgi:hypothetical protein